MSEGEGDRGEPIPQEVADGERDSRNEPRRQQGVGDAAVGEEDFADG